MELTGPTFRKILRVAAAFGVAMLVIACDRHGTSAVPGAKTADVVASLQAAVPTGSITANVAMPLGSDTWVFSAPYALEENWSKLHISVTAEDRKRLIDLNNGQESVLIVRISGGSLVETAYLDGKFGVSPGAFVVQGGQGVRLTRREGSRPILIEKAVQTGGD